jgi:hypothetical protein
MLVASLGRNSRLESSRRSWLAVGVIAPEHIALKQGIFEMQTIPRENAIHEDSKGRAWTTPEAVRSSLDIVVDSVLLSHESERCVWSLSRISAE